jgi:xylulokinase
VGLLIGIDVGTSGTKALLVDEKGKILASATEEYPLYAPKPNWSEQDPADWWKATVRSIRAVLKKAGKKGRDVGGLGLSGQMHGSVFLDSKNKVIRRAILWNDQRTAAECDEIHKRVGEKKFLKIARNPALTGFTAPKILWLRNNEPKHYKKVAKILLPKDYVRFLLTGEYATEVSDASGTVLLDIKKRDWSPEILKGLDIPRKFLPDVYESQEVSGCITAATAKETGLVEGTPVVGGGGDQAAGAVGNGIVRTGVISATLGTSGVVFAACDKVETPKGLAHVFCHAVPGMWHVMGVMLSAGGSLQWFRNELCKPEMAEAKRQKTEAYDLVLKGADNVEPGSEGLVFLPYLTGERTPHADPNARGAFVGLSTRHTKAHMVRSVLEGVAYGMRDSLEIIKDMNIPIREIRVSGGGARSKLWRGIQAAVYGHQVVTINAHEGPAYGVALLAGVGTGVWRTVPEACKATIKVVSKTPVDRKAKAVYDKYYPVYGRLYRDLKGDFRDLGEIVMS